MVFRELSQAAVSTSGTGLFPVSGQELNSRARMSSFLFLLLVLLTLEINFSVASPKAVPASSSRREDGRESQRDPAAAPGAVIRAPRLSDAGLLSHLVEGPLAPSSLAAGGEPLTPGHPTARRQLAWALGGPWGGSWGSGAGILGRRLDAGEPLSRSQESRSLAFRALPGLTLSSAL